MQEGTPSRPGGQPGSRAGRDGPLLAVSGVRKSYRRRPVLREVSLEVHPGEVVAVTGENGAGKTTLLRICAGLETPDRGSADRHAAAGYCPQEPALLDLLTAGEHVALFAAGQPGRRGETAAAGRELLASFGVPAARTLARDLSGGARQKLSLALALLGQPRLLLLDEPYQGFDHGSYLDFWRHADAWRADGKGVVMVTHLLTELHRVDRVIELPAPREGG
jgi:ABC-2 type transport system ATP-binding protein